MNEAEKISMKEKENQLLEVKKHVAQNRVPVDSKRVKCVDGGYQPGEEGQPGEAEGAMAIPGGHLGISMNLLALGYEPSEAFALVKQFAASRGEKFGWHSDKHTEHPDHGDEHGHGHSEAVVGCGHCEKAIKEAEFYGVQSEDVREVLDLIKAQPAAEMDYVELDRNHREKGILVIEGTTHTVKPWQKDALTDNQYFIYDVTRHQQYLKDLTEFINREAAATGALEVDLQTLWDTGYKQTLSTLSLLGTSKGAPMYNINVDSENKDKWKIEVAGNAPTAPQLWEIDEEEAEEGTKEVIDELA